MQLKTLTLAKCYFYNLVLKDIWPHPCYFSILVRFSQSWVYPIWYYKNNSLPRFFVRSFILAEFSKSIYWTPTQHFQNCVLYKHRKQCFETSLSWLCNKSQSYINMITSYLIVYCCRACCKSKIWRSMEEMQQKANPGLTCHNNDEAKGNPIASIHIILNRTNLRAFSRIVLRTMSQKFFKRFMLWLHFELSEFITLFIVPKFERCSKFWKFVDSWNYQLASNLHWEGREKCW